MSEFWTLYMRLEGPMQSWGYRSRFNYRDTAREPTRSGIIGFICAAMGIARGEDISRFDAIRIGVRVEREGRIKRDFHTAMDVIQNDGKAVGSVLSFRDYLADASFTVGLESMNLALLEEIAGALLSPCWTLFLGRIAFPISVPPVLPDEVPLKGRLEDHLLKGTDNRRVVIEDPAGERIQHDWPIDFDERKFKPRNIHNII